MDLRSEFTTTLVDGLAQLIRQGKRRDYWCSTRATADALIALDHCLPEGEYPHIRTGALRHLVHDSDINAAGRNWNEEIWDTSVAFVAVSGQVRKYEKQLAQTRDWLLSKYRKSHAWNHEQWETLWALLALSRVEELPRLSTALPNFGSAIDWLVRGIGKPEAGMLMNWSNTALFVRFATNDRWSYSPEINARLKKGKLSCIKAILGEDLDPDGTGETLWTPEGWSNGLTIWALAEAGQRLSEQHELKILNWCRTGIGNGDLTEEDLAFVCIGLYQYLNLIDGRPTTKVREGICRALKDQVKDKPRVLTKHTYAGYWSIHVRRSSIRFGFYLILSIALSGTILLSGNKIGEWTNWIALIPAFVGIMVSIADFRQILPWNKSTREAAIDDFEEEE